MQGCVVAMQAYGITLLPLAEGLRKDVPEALQPWFADDSGLAGGARACAKAFWLCCERGPSVGYFPLGHKSFFICPRAEEDAARAAFAAEGCTSIQFSRGQRYVAEARLHPPGLLRGRNAGRRGEGS